MDAIWECDFPMTPPVRLLVGRSVGLSVRRSVRRSVAVHEARDLWRLALFWEAATTGDKVL